MSHDLSLLSAIELFSTLGLEIEHENHHALDQVGKIVTKEVYRVIGTYDYGWPQLAAATQDERESQGFEPNDPLLRTGRMRDSVWYKVEHDSVSIGTDDKIAVWQELGTSRIPPRPFLEGALHKMTPEVLDKIGRTIAGKVSGEAREADVSD
jgi:hypothetical protein